MATFSIDRLPLSAAKDQLSELAELVKAGSEKILTKDGKDYVALIDVERLVYYRQLEQDRIQLLLIDEAGKGLDDIAVGRIEDARAALLTLQRRRGG